MNCADKLVSLTQKYCWGKVLFLHKWKMLKHLKMKSFHRKRSTQGRSGYGLRKVFVIFNILDWKIDFPQKWPISFCCWRYTLTMMPHQNRLHLLLSILLMSIVAFDSVLCWSCISSNDSDWRLCQPESPEEGCRLILFTSLVSPQNLSLF